MSSGRISHVLIADLNIHFLLPVFQKPQIPLQLCLLQSCLLEGWCLCDFFISFSPCSPWCWGCCSGVMGAGTPCTLGCLQCWDVLPLPLPKLHLSMTLSFSPSQTPGSTLNTQSSPDCAGLCCFCSCTGRALCPVSAASC